jgi:hypothetical protein
MVLSLWEGFVSKLNSALLAILTVHLSGLSVSAPASAALIDLGNVTRDTAAQLDWLDLTGTTGLWYNDLVNGVENSWYQLGWRHATTSEVCELVAAHAAPPLVECPAGVEVHPGDVVTSLRALIGFTRI